MTPAGVGFGLGAAASWGSADFCGGIASRRASPLATVVLSQAIGLAVAVALLLAVGEPAPSGAALLWAALGGCTGFAGLVCLYRGMASGAMGLVASIAAVVAAGLPVVVGAFTGDRLRPVDMAGIVLALVALVLVTRPSRHASLRREGLVLAVLAGLGAGCFFIAMGRALDAGSGPWWLIVASRGMSLALALVLVTATGGLRTIARSLSPVMFGVGLFDVAGTAFFLLASTQGALSIAAVLASQHPAAVTILARLILRERLAGIQVVGIVAALVAIALIASP
jgi:drug/metabolite transporter (DMT)-like permease